MGRSLRSGKVIKSLSPPNTAKRGTKVKGKADVGSAGHDEKGDGNAQPASTASVTKVSRGNNNTAKTQNRPKKNSTAKSVNIRTEEDCQRRSRGGTTRGGDKSEKYIVKENKEVKRSKPRNQRNSGDRNEVCNIEAEGAVRETDSIEQVAVPSVKNHPTKWQSSDDEEDIIVSVPLKKTSLQALPASTARFTKDKRVTKSPSRCDRAATKQVKTNTGVNSQHHREDGSTHSGVKLTTSKEFKRTSDGKGKPIKNSEYQHDVSDIEAEQDACDSDSRELAVSLATKNPPAERERSDDEDSEDDRSEDDETEIRVPAPPTKTSLPADLDSSGDEDSEARSDGSGDDYEENNEDKGFTDENAKWLKPKAILMSSDDEGDVDDEFDNESDQDDMLEVEHESRLIDAEVQAEQEEADLELRRTIAQQTSIFHLPTTDELREDENRVVPPSELRARVEDILEVLADFKTRREPGRSRSEYIERLACDMAELFGYLQELVDYFMSMFGPNECYEFLEASDKPRPLVVRVNTLKARRKDLAAALMKRGVRLDPLAPWSKVGLKIYESTVPIGATPEYLAGHYMLQSAASMCPVMALGPQPGDRVLDMSAAPGGKTSYLSQLMRNKGVVVANDLKAERQKATVANLHRLGVRNVVTCCYDGRKIGGLFGNSFDRILLDAPCSGLGVISRDPSVKVQRTISDVQRCAHLQKELLLASIDALNYKKKGGGFMVYSTCSVAVAENEEVVNYLLSKRDVKLVETGIDFGKPGFIRFEHKRFHPSLALTRRFYPHVHNMDGFYVAKIQKISDQRNLGDEREQILDEGIPNNDNTAADGIEVKPIKSDGSYKQPSKKNEKKMQGRKRSIESSKTEYDEKEQAPKRSKMSCPAVQKSRNKSKNAKMCKPRRMKL